MAAVRHFDFKNYNIWSHNCHCDLILLLHTKLHQNWFTRSASRRPWLHNVQCAVARQRPSPWWQPHHSGHVGNMMGCDHPSFVHISPLVGELSDFQHFQYGAAVRHLEYEFCYSGPPTKSTTRFDYHVKIWYRSDIIFPAGDITIL